MRDGAKLRPGTLYLIPTPLGNGPIDALLPAQVQRVARELRHFIAERPKTARAFLKSVGVQIPLNEIRVEVLDEHTPSEAIAALMDPLLAGSDVGLVSEAGCPAIADPGAHLVALAHQRGITVRPLIGPSSILLALMGSGLEGQRFAFHGYLPADRAGRVARIQELERLSGQHRQTQIFIETPYRNNALLKDLLAGCAAATKLCLAVDLTTEKEFIYTQSVAAWRKVAPDLDRRPTVFLLLKGG
jgi:16S rRNA (cytidine1402-2'-O)-methyltransferase